MVPQQTMNYGNFNIAAREIEIVDMMLIINKLGALTVNETIDRGTLCMVHRFNNSLAPIYIIEMVP